eukprot:TRINITY_DN12256_c0_g3_i4.p1 TRINITY_DN12256_c0_g3~~TRINITY_DN12256_c0_g3_i4.p1  ORF type:complete len:1093 (+),score=385.46 TRINITY_DN12256_c0_g3_i4:446-3724(+)
MANCPLPVQAPVSIVKEVHQQIATAMGEEQPSVAPSVYPGPLAQPFTRPSAAVVRKSQYWAVEKSDGLRTLLVVKRAADFPRWALKDSSDASPLGLYDCLLLEMAREAVVGKPGLTESKPGIPLSHDLRRGESMKLCVSRAADGAEELSLVSDVRRLPLRRSSGWSFAYLFDRTNDVHLLLSELAIPTASGGWVECVAADGELVHDTQLQTTVWLAFDLACIRDEGGEDEHFAVRPLSQRIEALSARVVDPHSAWMRTAGRPPITLRTKVFWETSKLPELLSCIENTGGNRYLYTGPGGPNENDGVVFTPEDGVAAAFKPQSSETILKWKFPSRLTVDWRIEGRQVCAQRRTFALSYMVKDKTTKEQGAEWYKDNVEFKCTPLRLASREVPRLGVGAPVVGECSFDSDSFNWVVHAVRQDKVEGNSYLTIGSVLESVASNVTAAELGRLLDREVAAEPEPEPASAEEVQAAQKLLRTLLGKQEAELTLLEQRVALAAAREQQWEAAQSAIRVVRSAEPRRHGQARFIVRTAGDDGGRRQLRLQLRAHTSKHKYPRSFNYVRAGECFGLGCGSPATDPSSDLLHFLFIELANHGGCYHWSDCCCNARFVPSTGRWEVLSVEPFAERAKNTASVNNALRHLEETCVLGVSPGCVSLTEAAKSTAQSDASAPTDEHYARMTEGRSAPEDEEREVRSSLRRFNNWVKIALINSWGAAALPAKRVQRQESWSGARSGLVVVDLCCGRGGDLKKWREMRPSLYVGLDSCLAAVAAAARKYSDTKGMSVNDKNHPDGRAEAGMPAHFLVGDGFTAQGIDQAEAAMSDRGYDAAHCVSCQFSFHYAFSSEEAARCALRGVSRLLLEGGVFVGTTVHDDVLQQRLSQADGTTVGNSKYMLRMREQQHSGAFGRAYSFSLEQSVVGAEEYVMPWQQTVQLAREEGLELVAEWGLREFYEAHKSEYAEVWATVVNQAESGPALDALSADEQEAAFLYRAFVFRRVRPRPARVAAAAPRVVVAARVGGPRAAAGSEPVGTKRGADGEPRGDRPKSKPAPGPDPPEPRLKKQRTDDQPAAADARRPKSCKTGQPSYWNSYAEGFH